MNGLRDEILQGDLDDLLSRLLFDRIPFVFSGAADVYRDWRRTLAIAIHVDPSEIVLTGSAAVGCSLSPVKRLRPFDQKSDVDVAVVSDRLFSEAWHCLRTIDITLDPLTPAQRSAVVDHQKRYVYWGCIATDRLLPVLPFASAWLAARSSLAAMEPTTEREINFRVYKDFRALRGYQLRGLKQLRSMLLDPEGGYDAELP